MAGALAWFALLAAGGAQAQIGLIGSAISTAMDVRTKAEVANDTEISAGASKRLLDDKGSEWTGVKVLVFQQHAVIAGAVKTEAVKKRVQEVVAQDRKIRTLKNELLVGDVGSFASDTALETEINAKLTGASGINSVNMRWASIGGNVVLMGVALSAAEAKQAAAVVRGVKGVKSLKSHLRIVPKK